MFRVADGSGSWDPDVLLVKESIGTSLLKGNLGSGMSYHSVLPGIGHAYVQRHVLS